jgi:hypothetical protein
VHIEVGQNVVFRADGRVHHAECPPVQCVVCARSIRPDEPIRRDGDGLVHSSCWVRRYRLEQRTNGLDGQPDVVSLIRARIAAGVLPSASPAGRKVSAGRGSGRSCDGCERPIPATSVECELEHDGRTLRFHRACLVAWQEEPARGPSGLSGGSAASPWTLIFDLGIARRARTAPALLAELLIAAAETRAMAVDVRARSAGARAVSTLLRGSTRATG